MNNDFIEKQLLSSLSGEQNIEISNGIINDDIYIDMFEKTQQYVVKNKLTELSFALSSNDFDVLHDVVADYIKKTYFGDNILIERILADMTGYGFLNKYFADRNNIEEININSWDCIEVRYKDGRSVLLDEHFNSVQHAKDVILRILQQNNKHMDENKVYEISYIGKAVRIATTIFPIADIEVGIAASIRFIHSAVYDLKTLVGTKMLVEESALALTEFIKHGVSICFCGGTGAGKTTLANALLNEIPNETRLITLEGGTREFDLIKRDSKGKIINNRLHLQTRPHKDKNLNVDLQMLLDLILKFDPDVIAVGEMVSEEAFIAAETARTGHTVITTLHTNNAYDAYYKMFTLGIRKYDLDEKTMLKFMVDAFPIIVYEKKYPDNKRRIQTILEGQFINNEIVYNELYRYRVIKNTRQIDGTIIVDGVFEKVNCISKKLKQFLIDNGLDNDSVDKL